MPPSPYGRLGRTQLAPTGHLDVTLLLGPSSDSHKWEPCRPTTSPVPARVLVSYGIYDPSFLRAACGCPGTAYTGSGYPAITEQSLR